MLRFRSGSLAALPALLGCSESAFTHNGHRIGYASFSHYTRRPPGGLDPRVQLRHAGGCTPQSCKTRGTLKLSYRY